jgi:hypothetical protein
VAVIARHGSALGGLRRAPVVAVLVFCAALAALTVARADRNPSSRPSDSAAHAAALSDPAVQEHLARYGFDRVVTTPLDGTSTRVSFFEGRRVVLEAAVAADDTVTHLIRHGVGNARVGSEVGQRAPGLVGFTALFLLATLRLPFRRRENLDVIALVAFVVPVVLLNERYLEWSVMAACVPLTYLAARCAMVALGRPAPQATAFVFDRFPLWDRRLCVAGAAVALMLLSIPGGLVSDVALASMAGATTLLDGALPYGNLAIGELVHGDTYPLLAYVAYVPAAILGPVRDGFDGLDGALYVATGFALTAAGALGVAVRRMGGDGARVALAMLTFVPVMIAASSGSNDVVAAALVALALAAGTYTSRSMGALTAAGWVKLAPLALVPVWIAAARERGRALIAALAVTAAVAVTTVALGGTGGFADMFEALTFQAERGSLLSFWTLLGAEGAQLVFQAAVLAGIAAACVRVAGDPSLAADPRRMAGLGAAILLGVQLAANYWSYTYLAWVFPLIAVALLITPSRPPSPSA